MGAPEVVVLDTNVLVSALGWRGPEHRIYRRCRQGVLQMATSTALLAELRRVLRYPKLGFVPTEITAFIAEVRKDSVLVAPEERLDVVRHPADNRLLECAVVARAVWLVTGDSDLLQVRQFRGIRIARAREFIAALGRG